MASVSIPKKICKLRDVCTKIGSGETPSGGQENYRDSGIALIRSQNVLDFCFSWDNLAYLDDTQAAKLQYAEVCAGDVLFNITGDSVARACLPPPDVLPARVNQHVTIIRPDPEQLDDKFLLYYLMYIKNHMQSISEIGATRRAITKHMLENTAIELPPLDIQQATGSTLLDFDRKINNLNRQIKTLDQLAETYFTHWFATGKNNNGTVKGLDEIASFTNGLVPSQFPYKSGEPLRVVKIKELNSGFTSRSDICSNDIPEQYIVNNGDIIFSWSGTLTAGIWMHGRGALNQHLYKVTSENYPKWFYYYWIRHHLVKFRSIASDKATTMGHIQRHHLSDAKVIVPPMAELLHMDAVMSPILEKIKNNYRQLDSVTALRDILLPKLVSGGNLSNINR